VLGSKHTLSLSVDIVNTGYCVSVHFRKHSIDHLGRIGYPFLDTP